MAKCTEIHLVHGMSVCLFTCTVHSAWRALDASSCPNLQASLPKMWGRSAQAIGLSLPRFKSQLSTLLVVNLRANYSVPQFLPLQREG